MSVFFVTLCLPVQQQSSGYVYTLCLCSLLCCVTQYSNRAQGMCTLYVCVLCYAVSPNTATEHQVCVHSMSVFFVKLCLPVQQQSSGYVYTLCLYSLLCCISQYSNRAQGMCTLCLFFVTLCHPVQQPSSWYVYTLCLCSLLWCDT